MIEPDINQQMARFAPSQNPTDPGFDAIEKAVAGMSGVPMPAPEPVDMDIDRAVQDIAAQRKQDMASSLMAASEVNPDEAAQADVLGKRFGVGQDIALRNMAEMRRQAMVQDTERMDLLRKDPVLARYIADREFAAQASDDVGVLSMLRPMVLEAAMLQTQGGFFRVVGAGYERGATTSELGGIGTKGLFGFAEPGDFERAKELTQRMQAFGQPGLVGSAAEMIAQNVGQLRTIATTTVAGAALGSLAGPAGLVAGGALGATAGVVIGTGTMEAGNLYLSMREEGVSDDAAIPAAVAGGFLNGLIEVVGMKIASAPFKALASKVIREEVSKAIAQPTMRSALIAAGKAYGLQVGGESSEETLQEIVAIASEEIAKAADGIDSETSLRDATGRVIEAFAYGGMASALLGGIGPGANLVVDLRRASATQRQQEFFNGLAENRKESKLAQRNPQGYERFLAAQAQDTPAETIYVDAATARDVLAQSGTTTAQLEDILPGIRERLEQAVETGGDVTIPTSQFGARLANTELGNALLPHMRLSPDAMSATEAQAFEAERQAVVEEARTILAAKQEADAAFVAEAQQVEDEAFEQVRAVGQFTNIEARTIAKLRQAMVVVDAAEAGMTPAQYQRERGVPLVVQGEGMAAPIGPLEQADQFDQAGQRRTDTPEFREWSRNAPIFEADEPGFTTGTPMVVKAHHGTNKTFVQFKMDRPAWFAARPGTAGEFVAGGRRKMGERASRGSQIIPVYLAFQNPLDLRYNVGGETTVNPQSQVSMVDVLKAASLPSDEQALRKIAERNLASGFAGVAANIEDKVGYLAARYANKNKLWSILDDQGLIDTLKESGFDGLILTEGGNIFAALNANDIKSVNNRGTWSRATANIMNQAATLDSDYLAAVERGDMEAAQRMVNDAAETSMPNSKVRTVDFKYGEPDSTGRQPFIETLGKLVVKYHGGKAGAVEFTNVLERESAYKDEGKINLHNQGIWLANNPGKLGESAEMMSWADAAAYANNYLPDAEIYSLFANITNPKRLGLNDADQYTVQQLKEQGYDGAYTIDTGAWVAFSPEQVKRADAVVRDEQGNVVPLSRRFDITSPKLFEQAAVVPATIDAASNVESSFAFAGTQTFRNNRQFKKAIQDRVNSAAKDAGIDLTQFTPEVEQYLVRVAVADAITALRTNPNAVGWYNEKVTKALRLVSLVHPEIDTDPRAKFAFTWALAVTSNGLKVDKNFELAERAYAEYKRTGKMPTNVGAGTAQIAINESLGLFNELVEKYGIDEVEKFMTSKTTVKEVIAYTNKNVSGENLTTEVYGAAALGPKIGNGFFANLYGHFEQLTMDRWLMRTWGRWTGTLLEDNERNILLKREQLAGIIKAMPAKNRKQLEAIVGMSLTTDNVDSLSAAINKASMKKENRLEMAKIGIADEKAQAKFTKIIGEPTRGVQRISYGDEFRKLGNSLSKYLDGQKEAPSGPPERARIRKVFAQALADLQTQFPSLTMSDLQALLWYPEKRLYDAAKTADEGQTGYEDNAAPDYANSAAKLALAKGISQDVINSTIGEVDAELAAISAERTTGAERGIGNLVLRQDSRLAGAGFEQAARGPARGGFDPRTLNVFVGKGGDVSTLSHELIHLRIAEYLRMARSATPPARVMDDLDTLFVFMGVEGATPQERLDNYETMMIDQRRPLEEKVTYNFEIYLYEGKAPSVELRGVFDRLAAWMRRVYKSIRDDLNAIYRREFGTDLPILTPEVRSVFDRMLASEEQIKRQEAISGMKGLFQTQAESGMGDAEWAAYQAMQQEATDAAVTDLNTASMRQLQWLGNARARILRDLQKKHDGKRKDVTAEVAATVKVEPVYRAMTYLRYGRFVDTDGAEVEVEGTHRLDIEKVRAMYAGMPLAESVEPIRATGMAVPANVRPDITPLGTGKYGMLGRDGLDPDVVAETFGYGSGDEMVRDLLAAKPMKEAVAERTDAEMLRRYGDMNTPAALEAEVQKALHNEARARFVAVELRHIAKATQPVRVMLETAKQVAADMISDTTIRDLRPGEFVAAEARAARDAERIQRTYGITEPAPELAQRYGTDRQQALIRAKRAQLYQNQLAAEALRVKEYVDKQVKYLRGVMRDSNVKRMGAAAADQVAGLLERFEVAPVSLKRLDERRTMAKYLADLEAAGVVPDIAEEITDEARRVNYKELKVSEFRDLVDAVRQIEHIGKNEQKMRLAEERAAFEEVRDEIVTRIRAVGKVRELQIDPRTPLTGIGRTAAFLRGFAAQHLKAASIARILDGGKEDGPLWNTIIRTANDASDMETRMRAEASLKLGEILKPVFALGNMGGKGMFFPSIGRSLNREARISIALNLGNDGNRQRLLDGEGWTMEKLQPVLESLTEAEWMAVQQVWDFIDGYRPEIAAKERRLYGKEPTWVTPVPFTVRTSDGKEVALQGGYYPVKYDPVASDRVATVDAAEDAKRELQGAYTAATTRRSFVKARAKEVRDRPLLYTLDAAFSGVNDVIHDLSWHEWLISTNRLLRDTKFANAVRETRGPEFLKQLRDWSKDNATGARGQQVAGESVLSWLRQGISASGLGFNVVSAAMQVTGFNQSIVRIGAKYVGQGIVQFSTSPFESSKMVSEKSSFMAERGRTQFREINEIKNRVRGQTEVARRVTAGTYFLMMNMQRSVDIPTWLGAYQKALDAGKDDARAVALADQAVRDSQGSGLVSDLAAVERGGPAMKLFTVFYSYMNTVYNMTAVQTMTARSKGKLAADYAMLLVVPVVLGYAIKSVIQPDAGDDELDPEALARKLAAEELSYLMGTMVIVREFGGAAQLMTGAEGARMGYGGPAGLRAVGEVYGLATQAGQLEFDRAFRRAAINTLGAFTGLPSAQVNRTIDGIEALVEGEVTGPTAVLAPLTGVQR